MCFIIGTSWSGSWSVEIDADEDQFIRIADVKLARIMVDASSGPDPAVEQSFRDQLIVCGEDRIARDAELSGQCSG